MHEVNRECVWLRLMIQHIRKSCGLYSIKNKPTVLYEDNAACIAQVKGGYIKGDRTKYISPKFFYTRELQNSGEINVQRIRSSDNLTNLFTEALPTTTLKKLVHHIGMRQVKDIQNEVLYHYQCRIVKDVSILHSFSFRLGFNVLGLTVKVFKETILTI